MKSVLILAILVLVAASQMADFYNPSTSRSMLYYAKASYCSKAEIERWSGQACKYHPFVKDINVITNLSQGAQMYTAFDADANAIILAFRGSQNIQNWVANLDYFKTDYPYCNKCEVHKGFYHFWKAIESEVLSSYKSLRAKHSSAKTFVTGHSLGAAIATIAALELRHGGYNVDNFYIFGCPRVGNKYFAEYGAAQLPHEVETIHYHDPVPHVPLSAQGFVRIPTETYYYKKNDPSAYKWCPSAPGTENKTCSNKNLLDTSIQDHLHYLGIYTGCTDVETMSDYVYRTAVEYTPFNPLQRFTALQSFYDEVENVEQQEQQHELDALF